VLHTDRVSIKTYRRAGYKLENAGDKDTKSIRVRQIKKDGSETTAL